MKKLIALVVAVAFATPAFAQSTKPAAPAAAVATTPAAKPALDKDGKPIVMKKDEKKVEAKPTTPAGGTPTVAKTTAKPVETKKN